VIAVADFGMGNLRSVVQALARVAPEATVRIAAGPQDLLDAERVVLPGQGAIGDCMASLRASGLEQAVRRVLADRPVLGVCIGEQMLFGPSEEGGCGLDVLPGTVQRLRPAADADGRLPKVPHMGWNQVRAARPHALWDGIADGAWFYFVHSFHVVPAQPELVAGRCDYGGSFTCAVAQDNIFAVQFHPEKSAADGLRMYANFVRWNP
jgi:glutamine amidotransferase